MATEQEKVTGAPYVDTVAGVQYQFSPIDNEALAELLGHARSLRATALSVVSGQYEQLPEKVRREALAVAIEKDREQDRPLTTEEWNTYLVTEAGIRFFLWQSLRVKQPEIKEEDVQKFLPEFDRNQALGTQIVREILDRSGMLLAAKEGDSGPKKNEGESGTG